ncbi:MAG: hypothetical protein EOM20_19585, partial [Spartobacteria bacterium]|nr:hypothetical protein [Spartobacteria bacterium]
MKLPKNRTLYLFIGLALFAMLVYHAVLPPGKILFTTDDNIGAIAMRRTLIPHGFTGAWDDSVLIGVAQLLNVTWTNVLLWLLPLKFFVNWIHAIDLVMASFFLALFLRARRLHWAACAAGALAAFWVGSNFTLTYAGHIGKFGVLMFAALYLWLSELAVQRKSPWLGVLAGGAMGGMFLEQPDVALFFAMFLGPYTVYALIREYGADTGASLRVLAPLLLMTAMISIHPLYDGYKQSVKDVASVDGEESPQAKWEFITQWSWPPEECIDFIAPGYLGWRSGEPTGPYWGRMGRSAGWEETGQGFQNFKLESQYLGSIPFILLCWAGLVAWAGRKSETNYYRDMIFWSCALALSLLLSFGKYFPLYRLFAMLPMVSSIRNPNKFLQVFQLVLGIVAAYGMEGLVGATGARLRDALQGKAAKRLMYSVAGVGALLLLGAMFLAAGSADAVAKTAQAGWAQVADVIVNNRIFALTWGGIMILLAIGIIWAMRTKLFGTQPLVRLVAAWALVACMAVDVLMLARVYVQTMDR